MLKNPLVALVVTLGLAACPSTQTSSPSTPSTSSTSPPAFIMEAGVDRPGEDFKDFDLDEPRPEACRDACDREPACKAFTFVKAGVQGDKARCWLKQRAAEAHQSDCCTSGVRR